MLAGRYLRARRREGFVSVIAGFSFLGIMLGVATLIVVLSVMNGFRKELLDKILGVNGHIFVAPIDRPLTDYAEVADRIAKVPGVRRAIPLVEGQAFASSQYNGSGVLVRGVRGERHAAHRGGRRQPAPGHPRGFRRRPAASPSARGLAESLGLQVGDTITLITPRGAATPFGTAPRIKAYPVAAIFEIGMSEFDATFVFMPLVEAQAYFNRDGDVDRDRGLPRRSRPRRRRRARPSSRRSSARSCSPTGGSATAPSSRRSRSSATSCSSS